LYVSASQAVHAAPSDVPLCPVMHLQSVNSSPPSAELVCKGHVEHSPAPVAALYVPTSHAGHAEEPLTEEVPAGQEGVHVEEPAAE